MKKIYHFPAVSLAEQRLIFQLSDGRAEAQDPPESSEEPSKTNAPMSSPKAETKKRVDSAGAAADLVKKNSESTRPNTVTGETTTPRNGVNADTAPSHPPDLPESHKSEEENEAMKSQTEAQQIARIRELQRRIAMLDSFINNPYVRRNRDFSRNKAVDRRYRYKMKILTIGDELYRMGSSSEFARPKSGGYIRTEREIANEQPLRPGYIQYRGQQMTPGEAGRMEAQRISNMRAAGIDPYNDSVAQPGWGPGATSLPTAIYRPYDVLSGATSYTTAQTPMYASTLDRGQKVYGSLVAPPRLNGKVMPFAYPGQSGIDWHNNVTIPRRQQDAYDLWRASNPRATRENISDTRDGMLTADVFQRSDLAGQVRKWQGLYAGKELPPPVRDLWEKIYDLDSKWNDPLAVDPLQRGKMARELIDQARALDEAILQQQMSAEREAIRSRNMANASARDKSTATPSSVEDSNQQARNTTPPEAGTDRSTTSTNAEKMESLNSQLEVAEGEIKKLDEEYAELKNRYKHLTEYTSKIMENFDENAAKEHINDIIDTLTKMSDNARRVEPAWNRMKAIGTKIKNEKAR